MMRVTGNKLFNIKGVSIQISLNGYSFYDTLGRRIAEDVTNREQIEILLKQLRKLTNKIIVKIDVLDYIAIPSVLFDEDAIEHYFKVKSIAYNDKLYKYIHSHLLDDTIAVVLPLDMFIYDLIRSKFNSIVYTHSIIEVLKMVGNADKEEVGIFIYSSENYFAMSLACGGKLLFTDCLNIALPSDIMYYIRVLIAEKGVIPTLILCSGINTESLVESLSNYHPNVRYISEVK